MVEVFVSSFINSTVSVQVDEVIGDSTTGVPGRGDHHGY